MGAVEPFPRRAVGVRQELDVQVLLDQLSEELARLAVLAQTRLAGTTRAVVEVVVADRTLSGVSTARSEADGRVDVDQRPARVAAEAIVPVGSGPRVVGFVVLSAADAAVFDGREAELQRTAREVGRAAASLRVLAAARVTTAVLMRASGRAGAGVGR